MTDFAPASLKREGAIANPDEYAWECNLNTCAACRERYLQWKQQYLEQERQYDPRTVPQHPDVA